MGDELGFRGEAPAQPRTQDLPGYGYGVHLVDGTRVGSLRQKTSAQPNYQRWDELGFRADEQSSTKGPVLAGLRAQMESSPRTKTFYHRWDELGFRSREL